MWYMKFSRNYWQAEAASYAQNWRQGTRIQTEERHRDRRVTARFQGAAHSAIFLPQG
jgi:hypothetical protein